MGTNRRQFIRTTAVAGGTMALGLGGQPDDVVAQATSSRPGPGPTPPGTASRRIRLLILGGTGFIGPHQVRYAVERGHHVTIFNRGRSASGVFDGVEELIGDRAANDYASLRGRTWDAVIVIRRRRRRHLRGCAKRRRC